MKRAYYFLAGLFLLAACSAPKVMEQRTESVEGNHLQITTGTMDSGRFLKVENTDKRWIGSYMGGKEKWEARRDLLHKKAMDEIGQECHGWAFSLLRGPYYNMLDSDETMGGATAILGTAAAMVAYLAAYAGTQDTNIPASVDVDFRCRSDDD